MPTPRLIHPIPVTIEQLDTDSMLFDEATREPLHGATSSGTPIKLMAQITWYRKDDPSYQTGGVRPSGSGAITVRTTDLRAKGVTLKRGDRITSIGSGVEENTPLDLYLTEPAPMAHWDDKKGNTLVKWTFEDRSPVKQPV